jgi:hypothetical protein
MLVASAVAVAVLGTGFYVMGIVRGGGSSTGSRQSPGTTTSGNPSVAVAPRNNKAAIFNKFGRNTYDIKLLMDVKAHLEKENYVVSMFDDPTEGAQGNGTATMNTFISMAGASVIVFDTHGHDPSAPKELGGDCAKGLYMSRDGAPAPTVAPQPSSCPAAPVDVPQLLTEWYPATASGLQARNDRYRSLLQEGFDPSWLGPLGALADTTPMKFSSDGRDGAHEPAITLSAQGIAHFFSGKQIALVDGIACHSIAFAPGFDALSYFGYSRSVCPKESYADSETLFTRLTGFEGVPLRTTSAAYAKGGYESYFQLQSGARPVVLSPAVESVIPVDGGHVNSGISTPVTVQFDARMVASKDATVVKAAGCGARIANLKWPSDGVRLTYDLVIPKDPPDATVKLTIAHEKANASPGNTQNDWLDGNQKPLDKSGEEPNGDDYVWTLSCASGIAYKDGCALLSTGDAAGYMTTSGATSATSAPAGVPGTPWHPAQLRSPGWVYPCTWSASKQAVDSTKICFWGSGAAPPQYTLILQNHIEPSSDTAVSYITSNKDYQVEEISSLKGKTYADLTVERAFFLWREPQQPEPQTCNAGMGSQGAVFVSLTGPLLHDTRAIFEFDLATQDVLALTSRSDVEATLLRMAAQVLPRVR